MNSPRPMTGEERGEVRGQKIELWAGIERTISVDQVTTCHKPTVMADPGSTSSKPGPARANNNNNNNNVEEKKQNGNQHQNAQTAIVLGRLRSCKYHLDMDQLSSTRERVEIPCRQLGRLLRSVHFKLHLQGTCWCVLFIIQYSRVTGWTGCPADQVQHSK